MENENSEDGASINCPYCWHEIEGIERENSTFKYQEISFKQAYVFPIENVKSQLNQSFSIAEFFRGCQRRVIECSRCNRNYLVSFVPSSDTFKWREGPPEKFEPNKKLWIEKIFDNPATKTGIVGLYLLISPFFIPFFFMICLGILWNADFNKSIIFFPIISYMMLGLMLYLLREYSTSFKKILNLQGISLPLHENYKSSHSYSVFKKFLWKNILYEKSFIPKRVTFNDSFNVVIIIFIFYFVLLSPLLNVVNLVITKSSIIDIFPKMWILSQTLIHAFALFLFFAIMYIFAYSMAIIAAISATIPIQIEPKKNL